MIENKFSGFVRLTRDPKSEDGVTNGKTWRWCRFGVAIVFQHGTKAKEWKDKITVFAECECWNNNGTGKNASLVYENLKKGQEVYIEARLKPNQYTDKNGVERYSIQLYVDQIKLLHQKPKEEETVSPPTNEEQGEASPSSSQDEEPDQPI